VSDCDNLTLNGDCISPISSNCDNDSNRRSNHRGSFNYRSLNCSSSFLDSYYHNIINLNPISNLGAEDCMS
jgi:hypothetical protein